uniref:Uncharacterized protein n=1 Tax=Arundo donax TaxID=35708 RepID=A0A0A8ZNT6_ARUDO
MLVSYMCYGMVYSHTYIYIAQGRKLHYLHTESIDPSSPGLDCLPSMMMT